MLSARIALIAATLLFVGAARTFPQAQAPPEICPRPAALSRIQEPEDLRSQNGVLKVEFSFRSETDAHGRIRYCYIYGNGIESPNLRLHPGDLLILTLKNQLTARQFLPRPPTEGSDP
jgi:hypothetical protein